MAVSHTKSSPKVHSPLEWLGIQIAKREGFVARCVMRKTNTKFSKVISKLQHDLVEAQNKIRELQDTISVLSLANHTSSPKLQDFISSGDTGPTEPTNDQVKDLVSPSTSPVNNKPNLKDHNPTTTKEDSPPHKSTPKALSFWKTWEKGTPPETKIPSIRGPSSSAISQLDPNPSPTQSPYLAPPPSQPILRPVPEVSRDLRTPLPEPKPEPTMMVPAQTGHPSMGYGTIRILHQEHMEISQEQYDALDELLAPRSNTKIRKKQKKK